MDSIEAVLLTILVGAFEALVHVWIGFFLVLFSQNALYLHFAKILFQGAIHANLIIALLSVSLIVEILLEPMRSNLEV